MIRQYIGARYVPKFVGTYDNTQVYEALDVVDNGLGTSYIAKQPVPAGTPLTNTTYWALYGSTSGAIINLQNQIGDLSELETTDNTDLVSAINTRGIRRKAVYLGNSFAQGVGSTSGTRGLFALSKDIFDEAWLFADGGVGFLTYTNHTITFNDLLDQAIASTSFDNSEITDVIILSAFGDTSAMKNRGNISTFTTELTSAMTALVSNAQTNFPNLKSIRLAFVETRNQCTITGTSEGTNYYNEPFQSNKILQIVSGRCGIDYLGWVAFPTYLSAWAASSDHYHPSDDGYTAIGSYLRTALQGGEVVKRKNIGGEYTLNITSGSTIKMTGVVTPDYVDFSFDIYKLAAGNTPAQYNDDTDFIDIGADITNNLNTIPFCFGYKELGTIFFTTDQSLDNVVAFRCYTSNSNGAANIAGQAFNTSVALSAGNNRSELPRSFHIEITP